MINERVCGWLVFFVSAFHWVCFISHHVRANGAAGGGGAGGPAGGAGGGTAGAGDKGGAISMLGGPNGENGLKNGFGGSVPRAGFIFDAITVPMWPGNGAICNAE